MTTAPALVTGPLEGESLRVEILAELARFVDKNAPLTTAAPETREAVIRRLVDDLIDVFSMTGPDEWEHTESAARVLLASRLKAAGLAETMSTLIVSAKSGALRRRRAPQALAFCRDAAAALPGVGAAVDAIATGGEAEGAVPTGLVELDAALNGGLPRGEIALVLGATGGGKTAFAMGLAADAARHDRGHVVVSSPEMKADDLWLRLALRGAGVARRELRPGSRGQEQAIARVLATASMQSTRANLSVLDRADADVADAIAAARALHYSARGPVYLVVLDYAQQLAPQGNNSKQPRYLAVADVATQALAFATESGCAVLLTTQVNAVRGRSGDIVDVTVRESAVLEHKAAVSMLLVPDREARLARLSLRKNRHGPIPPPIELAYAPELFRFTNPERE